MLDYTGSQVWQHTRCPWGLQDIPVHKVWPWTNSPEQHTDKVQMSSSNSFFHLGVPNFVCHQFLDVQRIPLQRASFWQFCRLDHTILAALAKCHPGISRCHPSTLPNISKHILWHLWPGHSWSKGAVNAKAHLNEILELSRDFPATSHRVWNSLRISSPLVSF
jgi:hypothetical protein